MPLTIVLVCVRAEPVRGKLETILILLALAVDEELVQPDSPQTPTNTIPSSANAQGPKRNLIGDILDQGQLSVEMNAPLAGGAIITA